MQKRIYFITATPAAESATAFLSAAFTASGLFENYTHISERAKNLQDARSLLEGAANDPLCKIVVALDDDLPLEVVRKDLNASGVQRKDIHVIGGCLNADTEQDAYEAGLALLKQKSVNLCVAAAPTASIIIAPEEAAYGRDAAFKKTLEVLATMTHHRTQLTFTQSTVVAGEPVPWSAELVPQTLRTVVDYCRAGNAYKPFLGATAGHFAVKLDNNSFLTSIRRSNFNDLDKTGLVLVVTDGPDSVIAYGAKPSVGGHSQRIVFRDHAGYDCILHFHCPLRPESQGVIATRTQQNVECGSHQCGKNTSDGMREHVVAGGEVLKAVMLVNHGPNILFKSTADPQDVIDFINTHFDLSKKTGGYQLTQQQHGK